MQNNLIALDADGVLLNYHEAYARAWEKAFGVQLKVENQNAYWAKDRYKAKTLSFAEKQMLREAMDSQFWSTMAALPGAKEACLLLQAHGYRLVCVSAVRPQYATSRASNLASLGFGLEDVIATGSETRAGYSPKAVALKKLKPAYFVDDYAPYFQGMEGIVGHKALVMREPEGSPNVGSLLALSDSQHESLWHFAQYLTSHTGRVWPLKN